MQEQERKILKANFVGDGNGGNYEVLTWRIGVGRLCARCWSPPPLLPPAFRKSFFALVPSSKLFDSPGPASMASPPARVNATPGSRRKTGTFLARNQLMTTGTRCHSRPWQ